ncbi:hypothetical protein GQX73_g2212 [Xylaria multiplex]|uniref:2EXR domain-containing protein n=1 Tax=Xylaria multiplex TaxID=323545 RepID=A0A7C8MTT2_9PEZI|nr:hypothetical protein GQX73_g2212 [Xylaria multiplex]
MPYQTRSRTKQQAEKRPEQRTTRQTRNRTRQNQITRPNVSIAKRRPKGQTNRRTVKPPDKTRAVSIPFNNLPIEIRLMIWEEFTYTPRIIHLDIIDREPHKKRGLSCRFDPTPTDWYFNKGPEQVSNTLQFLIYYLNTPPGVYVVQSKGLLVDTPSSSQLCPLLGVNRESRYIALKQPLICFELDFPVFQRNRFENDRVRRAFAIRRHDVVFLDHCEAWAFDSLWPYGSTAANIANIMINLDIHHLDYQNPLAIPSWADIFFGAIGLIRRFQNLPSLENFYCLTRGSVAQERGRFDFEDLRQLAPAQFPEKVRDLEVWLSDYDVFPGMGRIDGEYYDIVKKAWKNVSVE